MTTEEIIRLVPCAACNARPGIICQDSAGNSFDNAVHDIRRKDAIMRRDAITEVASRKRQEPVVPILYRRKAAVDKDGVRLVGRDCAWCGVEGTSKPVSRYGVTWDLCPLCVQNLLCTEAMATEGKRLKRVAEQSRQIYPEQDFPVTSYFNYPPEPEPPRVINPWASWNSTERPLNLCERLVPCPVCAAPMGRPCLDMRSGSLKGRINSGQHREREDAMMRQAEQGGQGIGKDGIIGRSLVDILGKPEGYSYPPPTNWDEMMMVRKRNEERRAEEEERARKAFLAEQQARQTKPEGTTLELKPLVGVWRPRIIEEYLVEGMDWPWSCGSGLGEVRVYYTLGERKLWVATIGLDTKSPGGLSREFWKRGRGAFVAHVDTDRVLHPVEVSADHRNGSQRLRWYGVLQALNTVEGVAEFVSATSAVEAIDMAQRYKNPQFNMVKPERRFTFD